MKIIQYHNPDYINICRQLYSRYYNYSLYINEGVQYCTIYTSLKITKTVLYNVYDLIK